MMDGDGGLETPTSPSHCLVSKVPASLCICDFVSYDSLKIGEFTFDATFKRGGSS